MIDSPAADRTPEGDSRSAGTSHLLAWAVYDWASNAYAAIVLTFVFAPYFTREVAADETTGTALWGLLLGVAGFFVALGGPVLGATVDQHGRRKPWLVLFTLVCVATTALLWFVRPSPDFLWVAMLLVAIGELGAEYAGVAYNAMLASLVPPARMGRWSGWGWTFGYAGGLLCLTIALLVIVGDRIPWIELDRESAQHIRATFPFAAAWYLLFAIPLLLFTPDVPSTGKPLRRAARDGVRQLVDTIRHVRRYANTVRFLIARLIFIDGLATLFMFGGVYAAGTFDMTEQHVLLFGIGLNVSAGLGAFAFSWIDDWIGGRNTILIGLVGLIVPGIVLLLVDSLVLFWTFGLILGLFVGPVQAASRSFLARIAPQELRTQMFGLYALSGKIAFLCPLLVGLLTWLTGSQRVGMSMIIVFFTIGLAIVLTVSPEQAVADQAD